MLSLWVSWIWILSISKIRQWSMLALKGIACTDVLFHCQRFDINNFVFFVGVADDPDMVFVAGVYKGALVM